MAEWPHVVSHLHTYDAQNDPPPKGDLMQILKFNSFIELYLFYFVTTSRFSFSQSAPVILAPHWTPAAPPQVTATAGPTTAEPHASSVLLVTTVTQPAPVSRPDREIPSHGSRCVFTLCLHVVSPRCVFTLCLHVVSSRCVFTLCLHVVSPRCVFTLCLHVVSPRCVFTLCLHVVSPRCVSTLCLHVVSSRCVFTLCLHVVSSRCVFTLCLHVVSSRCVSTLCLHVVSPRCVSTLCLHVVSSRCVFTLCLHVVSSRCVLMSHCVCCSLSVLCRGLSLHQL